LHKQEKVTRSHGCERKNERTRSEQNQKPQQKLDSSFRWNDEREAKTLDSGLTRAILALALRAIRCANVRARSRARSRRNDGQKAKAGFQPARE